MKKRFKIFLKHFKMSRNSRNKGWKFVPSKKSEISEDFGHVLGNRVVGRSRHIIYTQNAESEEKSDL